ncbi:MAG: RidA family protein [Spirochaetales bacterium]|nr:RidA family protein [Spirochaetales bacterium]
MKKLIATENAPGAIGPYSQAVEVNGMIYTSGQLGIDPATGELPEGVEAQTEMALKNAEAILKSEGLSLANVFKTLVFIKDMNDFGKMNGIYSKFFSKDFPARSCVEVARLPKDGLVEIEVIAIR